MSIFRRLQNLWCLSQYRIDYGHVTLPNTILESKGSPVLVLDIENSKKRPATIVGDEPLAVFPHEQ